MIRADESQALDRFKPNASFRAWLVCIVVNQAQRALGRAAALHAAGARRR